MDQSGSSSFGFGFRGMRRSSSVRAIDRRAVVMLPSGAGLIAPDTNAALALTATHDTIEARTAWIDAVRRVLDEAVAAPGTSPYAEFWRPGDECRLAADVPVTCSNPCIEERPHFSPEGRADCHVYVASDPKEGCPESRGLMPSNASVAAANGPVCEMRQLEDAALESCRHDLSCAECEPGYCFSAIESLVAGCEMRGKVASPRFVNGAANVPSRKVYIYCDE